MWQYDRALKQLSRNYVNKLAVCYCGNGKGLNNPALEAIKDVGPLPAGRYRFTNIVNSPKTGPNTILLEHDPGNVMYGRDLFRIHGDNKTKNNTASDGCIVVEPMEIRIAMWFSGDRMIEVT